jgi:hypothetical protein
MFLNKQTMHLKSIVHNSIATTSYVKNLTPWRDSNPGLLFLRRMHCQLRHG